ncbi:hypothetical protein JTB14_037298 [Gonioctena quinquepunctata]|nr:hypothetical protein JTB14_037298 [Gonioctena quinquepunctata]
METGDRQTWRKKTHDSLDHSGMEPEWKDIPSRHTEEEWEDKGHAGSRIETGTQEGGPHKDSQRKQTRMTPQNYNLGNMWRPEIPETNTVTSTGGHQGTAPGMDGQETGRPEEGGDEYRNENNQI